MTSPQPVHPDVLAMREMLSAYPRTGNCQDCQQRAQLITHPGGQTQSIAAPSLVTAPQPFIETLGGSSVDVASLATLYAGDMSGVCTPCTSVAPTYFCGPLESSGDIYTSGSLIGCHVYASCDLTVDGPTTLNGDLAVSGSTTLGGTLTVGGKTVGGVLTGLNQMIRGDASGNEVAIAAPATAGLVLGYNGSSIAWVAGATAGSGTSGVNSSGGLQLYPTSGNLISGYPSGSGTPSFTVAQNGTTTIGNTGSQGDLVVHGQLSVLPINTLASAVIINAPTGMTGYLLEADVNGTKELTIDQNGQIGPQLSFLATTQTAAPANGTAGAVPANPDAWARIVVNSVAYLTPLWLDTTAPPSGSSSSIPGSAGAIPGVMLPGS